MNRMLLAILTALLCSVSAYAKSVQVAGWNVEPFVDGSATGCSMAADYQDGTRVGIVMFRDYSWGLTLHNSSWGLREGSKLRVNAYVDSKPLASGSADIVAPNLALIVLNGAASYQALRLGHQLQLFTNFGDVRFRLSGTAKAMSAVLVCVGRMNDSYPTHEARSSNKERFSEVSTAEATVLVTNMLNAASVRDYKLLPPPNKKENGVVYFTLADGTFGAFFAFRGRGTPSADDAVGTVISNGATDCKGDFLSGKQSLPSTDGSVIRKVVATCRVGGNATVTETVVIRRDSGFLLTLQQSRPEQMGSSDASSDGPTSVNRPGLLDAALSIDEPGAPRND